MLNGILEAVACLRADLRPELRAVLTRTERLAVRFTRIFLIYIQPTVTSFFFIAVDPHHVGTDPQGHILP